MEIKYQMSALFEFVCINVNNYSIIQIKPYECERQRNLIIYYFCELKSMYYLQSSFYECKFISNNDLNRIQFNTKKVMQNCGNKAQPIPYSKIFQSNQLIPNYNEDIAIPDQHSRYHQPPRNNIPPNDSKRQKHNENQNKVSSKLTSLKENNYFNKTYASGCANIESEETQEKKLTHGMTSYKDIKNSHLLHMSGSREKTKTQSRSGSKSKLTLRLNQQYMNNGDRDSMQCTFTPKRNTGQSYKTFKDFVDFQQNFLTKKQQKIQKMKKEIEAKQSAQVTLAPKIDKKSRKISQSNEQFHLDKNGSLKKLNKKAPIYQRLYNLPRKKDRAIEDEESFTPKILNKSKSMIRSDKVQNLLYEDAQRRIEQQKLLDSEIYKKQQLSSKYPPLTNSTRQSKHNNKLICKKIRSQFLQLLQTEWDDETVNNISPILALTILSEIFNVQINPNKNQELCFFVLSLLTQDDKGRSQKGERYVETRRLWDFIKSIVAGIDGYDKGSNSNSFTEDQVRKIHQELGYFYSLRLSKSSNKLDQQNEEQNQIQIQTSQKTKRLAQAHRARKLEQISEFISDTNVVQIISNSVINGEEKTIDEKTITLQDLFILDSIRKKSENQRKKIMQQQQQIKKCTFRPSLNQKSVQKALQRKARSRQNLKTIGQCKFQQVKQEKQEKEVHNKQNEEKGKKIVIKSKKAETRQSLCDKSKPLEQNSTCRNIKNVDKTLLRLNIARKMKDIENVHKERGYECGSQNWLEQVKQQKKQILGQVSNFLGYKQRSIEKSEYVRKQVKQNYQSWKNN